MGIAIIFSENSLRLCRHASSKFSTVGCHLCQWQGTENLDCSITHFIEGAR